MTANAIGTALNSISQGQLGQIQQMSPFPDFSSITWNGNPISTQLINKCIKNNNKTMNEKYYQVLKDTPAWKTGAIIEGRGGNNGYSAINAVYETEAAEGISYYETKQVVENSPEYFERVYRVAKDKKTVYTTKEAAQKIINDEQAA